MSRPDKASVVRRSAEGPGALQHLIKASIVVPDLEAAVPAAAEPKKDPTVETYLVPTGQSFCRPARRKGTGALQHLIKALIVVPDLEGCSPGNRRTQKKIQRWRHTLSRPSYKASVVQRGAEGPRALEHLIQASNWSLSSEARRSP